MERLATVTKRGRTRIDYHAIFDEIDANGDGLIDRNELRRALTLLNLHLTDHEIDWIFDEFGDPLTATLPYRRFQEFIEG